MTKKNRRMLGVLAMAAILAVSMTVSFATQAYAFGDAVDVIDLVDLVGG